MKLRFYCLHALLLALVLSTGAAVFWTVVIGLTDGLIMGLFPAQILKSGVDGRWNISTDGQFLISSGESDATGSRIFHTLDGQRAKQAHIVATFPLDGPESTPPKKRYWDQRVVLLGTFGESPCMWYFVFNAVGNRGYFMGYDIKTNHCVGYLCRNGFQLDIPTDGEQFGQVNSMRQGPRPTLDAINGYPIEQWSRLTQEMVYLVVNDGLMAANLAKRTVTAIRTQTDIISAAVSAGHVTEASNDFFHFKIDGILLRTPDKVILIDGDGKTLASYTLPESLRGLAFEFGRLSIDQAVIQTLPQGNEFYWIDAAGKIVRHETMKSLHQDAVVNYPWPYQMAKITMAMLIVPSPGGILGILVCNPWEFWNQPWRSRDLVYSAALWQAIKDLWLLLAINGAIAIVAAVFCYRRQRKYGLPWTWVWVAFVLIFGLPAYLGYLAHRVWSARLTCPNCGQKAPRDRPACFVCGKDFPSPALKGIEVFA
jgi:hypothetical protein